MARVNFEEKWWTDPRRSKLAKATGSEELADGIVAKAWRVAQEYWKDGRKPIPMHIFEHLAHSHDLINCGLAVAHNDGVYVRGSAEVLDWTADQAEKNKAAGKKSAEVRKNKTGSAQPNKPKINQNVEHLSNTSRTPPNALEPSDSDSVSVSDSDSKININICSVTKNSSPSKGDTFGIFNEKEFYEKIPTTTFANWLKLYERTYIDRQFIEILLWHQANPNKNKRTTNGWIRFISGWLGRNWDKYLKTGPNNKTKADWEVSA